MRNTRPEGNGPTQKLGFRIPNAVPFRFHRNLPSCPTHLQTSMSRTRGAIYNFTLKPESIPTFSLSASIFVKKILYNYLLCVGTFIVLATLLLKAERVQFLAQGLRVCR